MFQMSIVRVMSIATLLAVTVIGADSTDRPPQNMPLSDSCSELAKLKGDKIHRQIMLHGRPRQVQVQWGSGEISRAEAALLYVTLKYVQGYKDAVLEKGYETLCDVASNYTTYNKTLIHVGAKASKNDLNCSALYSCEDVQDICTIAGPMLNVMGLAMAPVDLQAQPYVTLLDRARMNPRYTEITQAISKLLDNSSYSDFETSYFLPEMTNHAIFSCDVEIEYRNPKCVNEYNELSESCFPILLNFDLNDTYYKNITKSLAQQIELKNLSLQLIPRTDHSKCPQSTDSCSYFHQPHDSMPTFRIAPALLLQQFAPKVFSVVRRFAPSLKDVKGILKLEKITQDIEEAACQYFLKYGGQHHFDDWALVTDPSHWVLVLLCEGDPDNEWYKKISGEVVTTLNKFTVDFIIVNCNDENAFNQEISGLQNSMKWTRMIGVVGRGAGASLTAAAANATETPVVLYDMPPDAVNLTSPMRAATGRVKPLALALNYFLKQNRWRRIAIISDGTPIAKDFTKNLLADSTLDAKERVIDGENLSTSATAILSNFQKENAFVFFVNTDSKAVGELLCAALNLGMSDYKSYAWIVRERGTHKNTTRITHKSCDIGSIRHFTVTYWWRGHNEVYSPPEASEKRKLRESINELSDGIWPPLTAPLVDAILLLWYEIDATLQAYPELQDNLHVAKNAKKIDESFSQKSEVAGIVQSLKQKDGSLEKPLVFVYEWHEENNCDLLAIWKMENETVKVISSLREAYPNGCTPLDGTFNCATGFSGDQYDQTCHDAAIFAATAISIVTLFLVGLGIRNWLKKLKQRDHMMQMRILARSEKTAAALGPFIVSRSSVDIREELGTGNFGRVHFGMLILPKRSIPVAVKSLREEASLAEESQFLHEACILSRLDHVNIVRLVGVCAVDGPPLVMMEHAFFCDLRRYLTSRRHYAEVKDNKMNFYGISEASSISPRELTRLAREAAVALDYLCFKKIVHRDVRAANCLINDSRTLKLADFGMAREIAASETVDDINKQVQSNGVTRESYSLRIMSEPMSYSYFCKRRRDMFPVAWMAPESIARGEFSSASDIWSLGVMMFEIVMLGERPFGLWSPQRIYQYLIDGGIPNLPLEISYNTREVIEMCWWKDPRKRATAAAIRTHLDANPIALRHALVAKNANLANRKNKLCITNDSGYSERDIFRSMDPRISTL